MRASRRPAIPLVLFILCAPLATAGAAPYERRWWTVDGGGHTASTNALTQHRLAGTAGQPDAGVLTGGPWRLRGGYWSGAPGIGWVSVGGDEPAMPAAFRLLAPAPNPARGASALAFELPAASDVVVRITDVQGRLVRELDRSFRPAGRHRLLWDGRDAAGAAAPTGLYFIHCHAGRDAAVTRLVLFNDGGSR